MRRGGWIAGGVVLAIVVAIWFFAREGGSRGETAQVSTERSPLERADPAELAAVPQRVVEGPADARVPVEAHGPGVSEPDPGGYPTARVFGRVVEVEGLPLAEMGVDMHTVGGPWVGDELHPDELPDRYETTTGTDGRFELVVPVPTSDWISLMVRPDDFHGRAGRNFGLAGGRNEDPVRAGDNDLGDFVLVNAGAIDGRILAADGAPLEGATARLDGSSPGGYSARGKSGADGGYRIAHVPAGVYDVEALAEGFVTAKRAAVTVRDGQATAGVDLMLSPASSIAGRVVDEAGAPLKGVRLWGWPESSGQGAGGHSREDGGFRIYLPQDEPYTLRATLLEYEKHDPGRGVLHRPGTEDIEIVLRKRVVTTYVVCGPSGVPVERFGLKIIEVRTPGGGTKSSSAHREPAELEDHPGGEVELAGDPELHDYTIVAPGFAPRRDRVAFDVVTERRQTIVLRPGATLRGQFVLDGKPVESPTLRLDADRFPIDPTLDDEDDWFSSNWKTDLDEFAGRLRFGMGAADGTFEVEDLAAGTYELTLTASGVAPLLVERVKLREGETLDLGTLAASAPGVLSGIVLLPQGISPAGLEITVGDSASGDDETAQTINAGGTFRFDGLAAGKHFLRVEWKAGVVVSGEPFAFDLAAGEQRDVTLDLSERVPCRVEVHVRLGGEVVAGLSIESIAYTHGGHQRRPMGRTNDEGVCVGFVRPGGEMSFRATTQRALPVAELERRFQPLPGGELRVDIEGPAAGELTVTVPHSIELKQRTPSRLLVTPLADDGTPGERTIVHVLADGWTLEGGTYRAQLGLVSPGTYRVDFHSAAGKAYSGETGVTSGAAAECDLLLVSDGG